MNVIYFPTNNIATILALAVTGVLAGVLADLLGVGGCIYVT